MRRREHFKTFNQQKIAGRQSRQIYQSNRKILPLPELDDSICQHVDYEPKLTFKKSSEKQASRTNLRAQNCQKNIQLVNCKRQKERLDYYSKIHERHSHDNAQINQLKAHKISQKSKNANQIRYDIEQRFIYDQYFTPNCDQGFFQAGTMMRLLSELLCPKDSLTLNNPCQSVRYKYFKNVQISLPKPKVFNSAFIEAERKKLHIYRNKSMNEVNQKKSHILYNKTSLGHIQVGSSVIAFCPLCLNFHDGFLLAHYRDSYIVNFENQFEYCRGDTHKCQLNQAQRKFISTNQNLLNSDYRLGALRLPGYFVATIIKDQFGMIKKPYQWIGKQRIRLNEPKLKRTNQSEVDFEALQIIVYLLNLKQTLLKSLRKYHDKLSSTLDSLSDSETQQYGWIGSLICLTTICLRFIFTKFSTMQRNDLSQKQKKIKKRESYFMQSQLPQLVINEASTSVIQSENLQQREDKIQYQQLDQKQSIKNIAEQTAKLSIQLLKILLQKRKVDKKSTNQSMIRLKQILKQGQYSNQLRIIENKYNNIEQKLTQKIKQQLNVKKI